MTVFDWNGDGKNDFTYDYIDYQIHKQSTCNNYGNNHASSSGSKLEMLFLWLIMH